MTRHLYWSAAHHCRSPTNRVAKRLMINLLAPVHDMNHPRVSLLRLGNLLTLKSGALLSHLRRDYRSPLVVLALLPRVPRSREKARGRALHTFKPTRT